MSSHPFRSLISRRLICAVLFAFFTAAGATVFGQAADDAAKRADEALAGQAAAPAAAAPAAGEAAKAAAPPPQMDLLKMASPEVGGIFMYPIYGFSFVALLFIIERLFALRASRIIPPALVAGFGDLATVQGAFDPRKAYRLCQQFPCTASNVIRSMLLKIGRPHSEVEHAVEQAKEREAERLYSNVRPLNLAASAAPLLGLIGTVQGMIQAFYATAHLPDGANKATALAEGVYVALVTTFAGLVVAIPAVIFAHYFEGKIQRLFREVDDLAYNLLPQLERYEGKLRVSRQQLSGVESGTPTKAEPSGEKPRPATSAAE